MIIKCPECGRQVSEKAPTCPTCGVQIAGKITRCSECGEIYFIEDGMCPNCHHSNVSYRPVTPAPSAPLPTGTEPAPGTNTQKPHSRPAQQPASPVTSPTTVSGNNGGEGNPQTKKKNTATIVVALVFAVIVCGGLFYLYHNAQSQKETEDYEFAMRSTDPEVLQSYLLRYGDAPQEHRDSIESHLKLIQKGDQDWQNACLSNSVSALKKYIQDNPESVHRQAALNKIDSLEWLNAQKSNDLNAVEEYIHNHPDGRYVDDANMLASQLKSTTVMPDEKEMVVRTFRKFFQSINSKDESSLTSTVGMVLNSFLGKSDATTDDVVSFLRRLYKEGVSNLNWYVDQSSYDIKKKEISENEYEYTVSFSAREDVEQGDSKHTRTFRVTAKVTNDGKISDFNLTEIK